MTKLLTGLFIKLDAIYSHQITNLQLNSFESVRIFCIPIRFLVINQSFDGIMHLIIRKLRIIHTTFMHQMAGFRLQRQKELQSKTCLLFFLPLKKRSPSGSIL